MEFQFLIDHMVQLDKDKILVKSLKEKKWQVIWVIKLRTMLNLEIIKSDLENNLYLKGSIPGAKNSTVFLRESIKNITRKTIKEKMKQN